MQSSFIGVVDACDNFHLTHPATERLVPFTLSQSPTSPVVGLLRPVIIDQLRVDNIRNRHLARSEVWDISLEPGTRSRVCFRTWIDTPTKRSRIIKEVCEAWRDAGLFSDVIGPRKWRGEAYSVYSNPFGVLDDNHDGTGNFAFDIERSACALFGIVTYGVHMTIYEHGDDGVKIWVPTRARSKQTWPGYLDNSVAGGIASGMGALETIVKESMEEASIADDIVRTYAKPVGAISYFYRTPKGWLQPEFEYMYEMCVPPGVDPTPFQPAPLDGEVEKFELLPLREVVPKMHEGRFKYNCALVIVDFLIRHGYITPENEPNFLEITTRLHGRFDYDRW